MLACLGRSRFIVKEIRYPAVPEAEEPAIVRFQTIKELTDAPEDVIIDYAVLSNGGTGERKAAALVVRKEVVQAYRTLCEAAGLKLAALTPRLVGIAACLRQALAAGTPPPEPADATVAVVVAGTGSAELAVLRGEGFLLARALPVGANLAGDVRRTLAVHAGQSPQSPVAAVYVTGLAEAATTRLAEGLEVPVHSFDPFHGVSVATLPAEGRAGFAGILGLLRLRAAGDLPVNFISPRQPKPPTNINYRLVRLAGVAVVTLFLGLIILGQVLHASWAKELAEVEATRNQVDQQLLSMRENAKRLKAIDDWDSLVWLDELYDLTARIPDVNLLRITSVATEPLVRTPKSKAAARVTIKGTLLGRTSPRKPLDQLVSQFSKEGYYTAEAPKVENDTFTLVLLAERRGPADYKAALDAKTLNAAAAREQGRGRPNARNRSRRRGTRSHDQSREAAGDHPADADGGPRRRRAVSPVRL